MILLVKSYCPYCTNEKESDMLNLFVYGTLKKGFSNHHYLKNSQYIAAATTSEQHQMYQSGIPFVIKNKGTSPIHGEVYKIDNETLKRIDMLEGHPHCYKREIIRIILDNGNETEAWIYFYPQKPANSILIKNGMFL